MPDSFKIVLKTNGVSHSLVDGNGLNIPARSVTVFVEAGEPSRMTLELDAMAFEVDYGSDFVNPRILITEETLFKLAEEQGYNLVPAGIDLSKETDEDPST